LTTGREDTELLEALDVAEGSLDRAAELRQRAMSGEPLHGTTLALVALGEQIDGLGRVLILAGRQEARE
jgi:hypothetical protein